MDKTCLEKAQLHILCLHCQLCAASTNSNCDYMYKFAVVNVLTVVLNMECWVSSRVFDVDKTCITFI